MSKEALYQDALEFHSSGRSGKISLELTKPLITQRCLSLAYSPGVAAPCLEIQKDPELAYKYTAKGNFVAVISNGTAVLGLGNLGALASKPVMEGKAALFKRFADIDGIDIEVSTEDPERFVESVRYLAETWGGINLEDIKAPECFIIEEKLKRLLNIPVFHDDQHGTAIVVAAGLINALGIVGKSIANAKIVVNGAGAAAIACIELIKYLGVRDENLIACDTKGVIYKGRSDGMNKWKEKHASSTKCRTLEEAFEGADVFLGLSQKGAVTKDMVKKMSDRPIVFAMANPDPEITPEEVKEVRGDAIIATGRSDYNNQINNVMCFPYIFRGALDVRATVINNEMKVAAAQAIADLARQPVTVEVSDAYSGKRHEFGPEYIIPVPFDSRLIREIPAAVAKAAMETGVAKMHINDFYKYKQELMARISPRAGIMNKFFKNLRQNPKKVIFTMHNDEVSAKSAVHWVTEGYGEAVLVGDTEKLDKVVKTICKGHYPQGLTIADAKLNADVPLYSAHLYEKMQRKGVNVDDAHNLVLNNSVLFASELLVHGNADALVAGTSKGYISTLKHVSKVVERKKMLCNISVLAKGGKTIFIADTAINETPRAEELAEIAIVAAHEVRRIGHTPRVAFLSFSNFGNPSNRGASTILKALDIMNSKNLDFEFDGELTANVALNANILLKYPFTKLSNSANVLIMSSLQAAHISVKLLQELGDAILIANMLCGFDKRVQIVQAFSSVSEVINAATIAVSD